MIGCDTLFDPSFYCRRRHRAAPALSAATVGLQSTAGSWRKSIIERRRRHRGALSEPVAGTMQCILKDMYGCLAQQFKQERRL